MAMFSILTLSQVLLLDQAVVWPSSDAHKINISFGCDLYSIIWPRPTSVYHIYVKCHHNLSIASFHFKMNECKTLNECILLPKVCWYNPFVSCQKYSHSIPKGLLIRCTVSVRFAHCDLRMESAYVKNGKFIMCMNESSITSCSALSYYSNKTTV